MTDTVPQARNVVTRLHRAVLWRVFRFRDRQPRTVGAAATSALESAPNAIGVDLFDTVVVRRLAGDASADEVVAHRIASATGWPATASEYLKAVDDAQRATGSLALDSWLVALEERHGLDPAEVHRTYLSVEKQLIRPVPGAIEALDRMRRNASLTFVSDMHLSAATLRAVLEPMAVVGPDDVIVASSDLEQSKARGDLFHSGVLLSRGFGSGASFIGNDLWSDATQAQLASLDAQPATAGNLTQFEAAMSSDPGSQGPAIAGAARQQRLLAAAEGGPDAEIRALGGQVIGQAILAFLLWIRQECRQRGITHLVFLARDGELPLEMARAMPSDHWDGFDLQYLHCGRRAWSLAAAPIVGVDRWVQLGTADSGAFLLHYATTTPFENLLDRCGLTIHDINTSEALAEVSGSRPLTSAETTAWREMLQSGDLDEAILAAAERPRRDLVNHLNQSGFPRGKTALIDVGWRGQQAWLVSALIREATGEEPLHLHFGGDSVSADLDNRVDIERFAFDDSREPHPISSPVACLEMFLASGKPRLLGYERDKAGAVSEVFETASTSVDNPTRRLLARGAIQVAAQFPSLSEIDHWGMYGSPLIVETRALLAEFWNNPTEQQANLLLGLRFEGDDSGSVVGPLINSYSLTELMGRDSQPRIWREASLCLTPWWFRTVMKTYFLARKASQTR